MEKCKHFLETVEKTSNKFISSLFISRIREYSRKSIFSAKLGHPSRFSSDPDYCKYSLATIRMLLSHFKSVRQTKQNLYKFFYHHSKFMNIIKAVNQVDVEFLQNVAQTKMHDSKIYIDFSQLCLEEHEIIILKYYASLDAFKTRLQYLFQSDCICCEKLCIRKDVFEIRSLRKSLTRQLWEIFDREIIKEHLSN